MIFDEREGEEEYKEGHLKSAVPFSAFLSAGDTSFQSANPSLSCYRYQQSFLEAFGQRYPFLVVKGEFIRKAIQNLETLYGEDVIRKKLAEDEERDRKELEERAKQQAAGSAAGPAGPPPPPPPPGPPPPPPKAKNQPPPIHASFSLLLYFCTVKGLPCHKPVSALKLLQSAGPVKSHELTEAPQEVVKPEELNYLYPSCVIEGLLYQGALESVQQRKVLEDLGIKHVICAAAELVPAFPCDYSYLHIPVDDTPKDNILEYFERAYQYMSQAYDNKEPIVVHCAMGISRSSTITLMFLIRRFRLTPEQAIAVLKDRRPFIQPNRGFLQQLRQWGSQ